MAIPLEHQTHHHVYLMEKSKLQSEIREIFLERTDTSALFPSLKGDKGFGKLCNQYQANQGKAKNHWRHKDEKPDDCVRRLVGQVLREHKDHPHHQAFRMILFDESHFLKVCQQRQNYEVCQSVTTNKFSGSPRIKFPIGALPVY